MSLTAQEKKELDALEKELSPKPKSSGLTPAEQKEMKALEAELAPKTQVKRKEIKRVEPTLSPLENIVSPIDRGLQYLNRVHSATNAGINEFGRQAERILSPENAPNTKGMNPAQAAVYPLTENLVGLYDAGKAAVRASDQEFKPGDQIYTNKKPVGVRVFSQGVNPKAPKAEQLIRRAMDLSIDVQTDPQALLLGLGLGGAVKGVKGAATLAKTIPAVQRGLARANAVVDPLAQSAKNSEAGAFVTRVLGLFGAGPHQTLKSNVIRPNELVVAKATRPIQEVLTEVEREILRLRKTQFGDNIDNYAANAGGADPIKKLLRKTIEERLASASPQYGVYPLPFNQLSSSQKGMLVKHLNNPFGVSPTWLLEQADKTINSIRNTESNLIRSGVRIQPGQKFVDEKKWLDTMFGEKGLEGLARNNRGIVEPVKGTVPQQIYEAGVRNFVKKIANDSTLVKPLNRGTADPGWVRVDPARNILGKQLGGMQIPEPLEAMLDVELSKAGKGAGGEAKSWYIRNKDWLEWVQKNVVGTVKKGLVAATSTQNANLFSNQQVAALGLKAEGINPEQMSPQVITQAYKDVIAANRGKKVASEINNLRRWTKSFDATEAGSNYWYGQSRPGMAGQIIARGEKVAYREPTVGEAVGKLYPPNAVVDFQGTSEQAFKLAMYRTLVANGKSSKKAARLVEKYLFDYSDRGVLLEIADRYGFYPFATYPTKALSLLMDTIVNHPELLAKFPRLQELKQVGYEKTFKNANPKTTGPFTIPYGNPEGKNTFDVQRFFPLGAQVQGVSSLMNGGGAGAALNAIGIGQPGQPFTSSLTKAPLASRFYDIAQGINPLSEPGKPKSLLEKGQPLSDLSSVQAREYLKNLAPSQLLGRASQVQQDVSQGKTSTNYPFSVPKTQEEVNLQYGLGVRTGTSKGMTEIKLSPEIKTEVKGRKSGEVQDYLQEVKRKVKTDRSSKLWDTLKEDADRFTDPALLKTEFADAKTRLQRLPLSGRSVVDGKLTDEGRETIYKQALYLQALYARWLELKGAK